MAAFHDSMIDSSLCEGDLEHKKPAVKQDHYRLYFKDQALELYRQYRTIGPGIADIPHA
jgi:hypothetical protein